MGGIITKDKFSDSFYQSTKYGEFHNNSSIDILDTFGEKHVQNSNFDMQRNVQNKVQLSKSKLSWRKDMSSSSFNDHYLNKVEDDDKDKSETFLTFNDKNDKINSSFIKMNFISNEDKMFNIVPVTLEVDSIYRSIIVSTGEKINVSPLAIEGGQIEVKKIFNENIANQTFLNDIENRFLILRINQEHLNKLPFIIENEKSREDEMSNIPTQVINTYQKPEKTMIKLGFSSTDTGRLRYLMFIKTSSSCGWKNVNIFQQYARTLIANERKTGCDIQISESLFLYRGTEVKPLIIEGNSKNQIIKCKSLLPKFIQQHLISDVQNIETEFCEINN